MKSIAETIKQAQLTVLIIEDDEMFANLLKKWIEEDATRVDIVDSAERGTFLVTSLKPDIILLDNNLPKLIGRDVIELYLDLSPNSKIFMMTAAEIDSHQEEIIVRGAMQFLDKRGLQKKILQGILLEVAASIMDKKSSSKA
jgi:DNA-binding response OmpR family regulator